MLAPRSADAIEQLTAILDSTTRITKWVEVLVNTVLPPMTPVPSWYQQINATLLASQQHAQGWLDQTAPSLVADSCNAIISYASMFANATADLMAVLAQMTKPDGRPSPDQLRQLVELVSALQQTAAANEARARGLSAAMHDFKKELRADLKLLRSQIATALPAEAGARAAVQQIQTQLESIDITLAGDKARLNQDSIRSGEQIITLLISVGFALKFGALGVAFAIVGVAESMVMDNIALARVQSDLREIERVSENLSDAEIQLGLMQGVRTSLETLVTGATEAFATFDGFGNTWSFTNFGLQYLLVVLAQPQIDISKIPDLNDLSDAVAAWQAMSAFAQDVLEATITDEGVKTIVATGDPGQALVSAPGAAPPIADPIKKNLLKNLNSNVQISAWCTAIINTTVMPSPGQWYAPFMANLKIAQQHATAYLNVIGPDAWSRLPEAIVNYGATHNNAMGDVQAILDQAGSGDLTSQQISQIVELFQALHDYLEQLLGQPTDSNLGSPGGQPTLYGTSNDLKKFRGDTVTDNKALVSGQQGAAHEVLLEQADEARMTTAIKNLTLQIKLNNTLITDAELGVAGGIFLSMVAMVAIIGTGGAALALAGGVAVLAVGGTIAAGVEWGIMENNIKGFNAQIAGDTAELKEDQLKVAALQGIILNLAQLSAENQKAQEAVEGMVDMFTALIGQARTTVGALNEADSGQVKGILEKLNIQDAMSDWQNLSSLAQRILDSTVSSKLVNRPTESAAVEQSP